MDTANPQVYKISNQYSSGSASNIIKTKLRFFIFGVLILIILIELVMGFRSILSNSETKTATSAKIAPLSEGKIILIPAKKEFKLGETVPISIKVVTGGKTTDSTDLILKYDSKTLQASGSSFIRLGKIYKDYPVADFDTNLGIIRISGITPPNGVGFGGVGNFATLYFTAKQAGNTTLSIDFEKGSTADSNLVLAGSTKDILGEVVNADIIIHEADFQSQKVKDNLICPGFYQYCQNESGLTGKQYCQSGSFENNDCGFDPKLTVGCSVCKAN